MSAMPETAAATRARLPAATAPAAGARWYGWAALAAVLAAWEIVGLAANIPALYLPRPTVIVASLYDLFRDGALAKDLAYTLARIFGGFALAVATGVAAGVWMGTSAKVRSVGDIFVAALYPLPKVTLIPLLIIWLGTGEAFQIAISWLGAIFPIIVNTMLGVQECDKGLLLAARDLRASERQIRWKVMLPSAIPHIFAGLRLGLGVSIVLVVAAEMVTGRTGLGARLFLSGQVLETGQVFAILLLLAFLGIALTKGQDLIDDALSRWRTD